MLHAIDYIEMYVGNIIQAAFFYQKALAFVQVAQSVVDRTSIQLKQNNISLLLTSSAAANNTSEYIYKHGDGVKDIAFLVSDVEKTYDSAIKNGAISILPPVYIETDNGGIHKATVATFGDTVHSFIDKSSQHFVLPSFKAIDEISCHSDSIFEEIDHVAICLDKNEIDKWIDFYCHAFGFSLLHEAIIDTGKSGMITKVVSSGKIKLVFTEHLTKYEFSQIEEYLKAYQGAGVQHVAYATGDIINSIKALTNRGLAFIDIPESYYQSRASEFPDLQQVITSLRSTNILIDPAQSGILMQAFSKSLQTRSTFFIEVIQRLNSDGFGNDNVKALFKAIEAEKLK